LYSVVVIVLKSLPGETIMRARTTILKNDPVAVHPEGYLGVVQRVWSDRGKRFASVLLKHNGTLTKVQLRHCKRLYLEPEIKPTEPARTYFWRAVNEEGAVVREGQAHDSKAQAEQDVRRVATIFSANVDIQIIERQERVCSSRKGGYRPELFD
jgi:hypothetical protein